jgi:hypothetical protein
MNEQTSVPFTAHPLIKPPRWWIVQRYCRRLIAGVITGIAAICNAGHGTDTGSTPSLPSMERSPSSMVRCSESLLIIFGSSSLSFRFCYQKGANGNVLSAVAVMVSLSAVQRWLIYVTSRLPLFAALPILYGLMLGW